MLSPLVRGLLVALLSVSGALVIKLTSTPVVGGEAPYLLYLMAVCAATLYGGVQGGIFASVAAAVSLVVLFPRVPPPDVTLNHALRASVMLVVGLLTTWLIVQRRRSEDQIRKSAAQLADLQRINLEIGRALTAEQVADLVVTTALPALGASAGGIAQVVEQGRAIEVLRVVGYPGDFQTTSPIPWDSASLIAEVVRTRAPLWFESTDAAKHARPDLAALLDRGGHRGALVVLPLQQGATPNGALALRFQTPRHFHAAERHFIETMAQFCCQALERARLYDAESRARTVAEGANRAKDVFLATLSHELRTPLNVIVGWVGRLRAGDPKPETASAAVAAIDRNAKMLMQLVEDLLDVSRIVTGKFRLHMQPVDLPGVVNTAVDTLRSAADAKALQLDVRLDEPGRPVMADPDRLQQVVWNLLSNAIKFTPEGGRIDVALTVDNSHALLAIRDSGVGIAPDFLPVIFEPFRQADTSLARAPSGLGLGLAIVKHLVELHGGTTRAESAGDGHGATFTVTLPLRPADQWAVEVM